jgi:ribosomal protein S18 acetylase RimI-like enzyme
MFSAGAPDARVSLWQTVHARRATEADVPFLLEMIEDLYEIDHIAFDPTGLAPALETLLGDPSLGNVWIFEQDETVAGYAIVTYGFDIEFNGRDAFLTDLYLLPAWRGRGVGQIALSLVEREARQAGVHALHLFVDPANERAVRLYRSARFEPSHRTAMTRRLDRSS